MPTVSKGRPGSAPFSWQKESWDPKATQAPACSAVPGGSRLGTPRFFNLFLTPFPRCLIGGMHSPKTIKLKPKTVVTPQLLGECSRTQTLLFLLLICTHSELSLGQAPITSGCCSGVALSTWKGRPAFCPQTKHFPCCCRGEKVFPESSDILRSCRLGVRRSGFVF